MSSGQALKLLVDFSLVIFLLRPITGLWVDAFKVMMRMALAGLILHVVPLGIINDWSHQAAGWAHISALYVPVICVIALVALSTANLMFLNGTTAEGIMRLVFYIVGGVFSTGSPEWIAWANSIGSVASGVLGTATHTLGIFGVVV